MWAGLLQWLLLTVGHWVFWHDFEKPGRPYLSLRYFLSWLFYGIYVLHLLVLYVLFIPLAYHFVKEGLPTQYGWAAGLAVLFFVATIFLLIVLTKIMLKRRRYYRSVKRGL